MERRPILASARLDPPRPLVLGLRQLPPDHDKSGTSVVGIIGNNHARKPPMTTPNHYAVGQLWACKGRHADEQPTLLINRID